MNELKLSDVANQAAVGVDDVGKYRSSVIRLRGTSYQRSTLPTRTLSYGYYLGTLRMHTITHNNQSHPALISGGRRRRSNFSVSKSGCMSLFLQDTNSLMGMRDFPR